MNNGVAIVAVAQTNYQAAITNRMEHELTFEITEDLVTQTGLSWADDGTGIDATITCNNDHWDGITLANIHHGEAAGSHLRPEEKVDSDGADAVAYGAMQILSGHYGVVLVVAALKESQTVPQIIENFGFEPVYHARLGLDFGSAAALQAQHYMHSYGIDEEDTAQVVVDNRGNAFKNPFAQTPERLTVEEVLSSPLLAYPIRKLEAKPVSDGACGLILASEERAKELTDKPVWIKGMGQCYDCHFLGDRDLKKSEALTVATKQAYRMAGVTRPLEEIDVVEISEYYAYQELMWLESMGFCDSGEGGKLVRSGQTKAGGRIPVNLSGGALSGNPNRVAGLARVAEAALQLKGEAGKRQVDGAGVGLAHGTIGPAGQHHCVLILSNEK